MLTAPQIARLTAALQQLREAAPRRELPWWLLAETIVLVTLGTALRRGELLGLRWRAVDLEQGTLDVREAIVRGRSTTPKSKASCRRIELGPRTRTVLEQHRKRTRFRRPDDLVFCHPERGTPLDPSAFARDYLKPALAKAGIDSGFRPFHDLRHTSLTHSAAAGKPHIYVQARAGHANGSTTERYLHPATLLFPSAAERTEQHMFGTPPLRLRILQILKRRGR